MCLLIFIEWKPFYIDLGVQGLLLAFFFHEDLSFSSRMQSSCSETVLSFWELLEGIVGEDLNNIYAKDNFTSLPSRIFLGFPGCVNRSMIFPD